MNHHSTAKDVWKAGHSIIIMASSKTNLLYTLPNDLGAFCQADGRISDTPFAAGYSWTQLGSIKND